MAPAIDWNDAPKHLFNIPELDFSGDLFGERLSGQWFRLGAWTITPRPDERGVEDVVSRQSMLLPTQGFGVVFDKLECVGNVIHNLGKPGGSVHRRGNHKEYKYYPFHSFEFPFTSVVGEPLVFVHSDTSHREMFINPDVSLFFELEEKARGNGIWWDPRRGVDALVRRLIDRDNMETVEIRSEYLVKYLQARQMSLVVGHYRHLHLFDPSEQCIKAFVNGDLTLGSPEQGAKAILQNWGLRDDFGTKPFLQRRLHFWFEIRPKEICIEYPWADEPPFDPYIFTLPTRAGAVAPARWTRFLETKGRSFDGEVCNFMDRVYFRQDVLTKYQGSSGFDVEDNGSVRCYYWSLVRSTSRLGNELLSTGIGDFAQGVPFDEWPHWGQHAVETPSTETAQTLSEEPTIQESVNHLVEILMGLNAAFANLAASLGVTIVDHPWRGSLDSLSARQLKWVYRATDDDDEFLKRATLASTLVLDGLQPASLRNLLSSVGHDLHRNFDNPPKTLGSRNLLQRVALLALLMEELHPDMAELPILVQHAEGKTKANADLQAELERMYQQVRQEFAPLAFLYDLRIHGGLAHPPNKEQVAAAAGQLGLPTKNWHRTDYLRLLKIISESILHITEHLEAV